MSGMGGMIGVYDMSLLTTDADEGIFQKRT